MSHAVGIRLNLEYGFYYDSCLKNTFNLKYYLETVFSLEVIAKRFERKCLFHKTD